MSLSEKEVNKISEIVRDSMLSKESLDLFYEEDITEFIACNTGKITVDLRKYINQIRPG
jgi:hypothetical protein